ncbi:MAG TPA: T9SS type A sorting domain-containing protein, partial [Bacteroidetes bacterium]|nr:T9SS type A sorting domain-containing protein [Bacteroidota bacterium]HEX03552.1 T9SS type A sorting domain-containing protein [Bacteroidota bacterium]
TMVTQSVGNWTPTQIGEALVTITVDSPGDVDPDNNYLERTFDVLPARVISGVLADSLSGDPLQGSIYWTQLDIEPVRSGVVEVDELTGEYSFIVAAGQYSLISIPDVTPYPPRTVQVVVTDSDLPNTDFLIPPSRVMVISDNDEASTDSLLMDAFAENDYDTYLWRIDERGMPGSEIQAESLDMLVWSLPQDTEVSFDEDEWGEVQDFRDDITERYGMIFNGDGVMQALSDDQKSELGVEGGEVDIIAQIIAGHDESPFLTSDSLLIAGILWQQDVDEVISDSENASPVGEFIPFGYLAGQALDRDDQIKTTVFGFGMEGINDLDGRFVSRTVFLGRIINWFGLTTEVDEGKDSRVKLPVDFSMSAYPNPFNASLRIQVHTSTESELLLFDILGREVSRWRVDGSSTVLFHAHEVASGMYFLRLDSGSSVIVQKVMLLR